MLEVEKAKLFIHKIPHNVTSEELEQVLSGEFTLDVKVKTKPLYFTFLQGSLTANLILIYSYFGSQQKHREVAIVRLLFSVAQKKQIKHLKTLMETKARYFKNLCFL